MKNKKVRLKQHAITSFMVFSIILVAFLTYKDILDYFFTGGDTLALIDTSRIQSFRDVIRIFTEPLFGTISTGVKFYRPISELSFGLDYFIWKLNPFGYHLTDLILHICVAISVFFLIRFLTNGIQITAWLSAIIFTIHPVLVETVPCIARRQDIIATLFLLLSLFFLKHYSANSRKKVFLFFYLFLYALALGAKEIAVILPILIFTYLIIYSSEKSLKEKVVRSVKVCLPFFIVTLIYLAYRTYILQGIGGYRSPEPFRVRQLIIDILKNYPMDLLYPIDFLRPLLNNLTIIFKHTGHFIALFTLLIFLLFYKRIISTLVDQNDMNLMKTLKSLLATIIILLLVCILIYPTISPFINLQIQRAYHGEGPGFIMNAMEQRNTFPIEYYFNTAKELFITLFSISMFYSVIFLIGIKLNNIKSIFFTSDSRKLMAFTQIWILLPFSIYLLTQQYRPWYIYISIIPFSAILSVMLVNSLQSIIKKIREYPSLGSLYRSSIIKSTLVCFTIFILVTVLSISLLVYSPLVRTYKEWEDNGNISLMFLQRLSKIVTDLPNNAIIHIYNLPRILSYKTKSYRVRYPTGLSNLFLSSWLNLTHPHMEIVIHNRTTYVVYPSDLDLEVKMRESNYVDINVILDKSN